MLKNILPIGSVGSCPPQRKLHALGGELVGDGAGIGNRPRQAVELGDHERVALAHGAESLVEAGARARFVPVMPWSV
ncbi:hypothetical protein SAMN05878503_108102 [Cereibacter ovatus]|uniref:Uncharacterized protein n=1 Tax=Cereibacter ovatus TaxID=439529 RepID=A0A285CU89_9RHOB|nr:hypothetical protein SAMN05878503_108102 [Cereibacter ovatus]